MSLAGDCCTLCLHTEKHRHSLLVLYIVGAGELKIVVVTIDLSQELNITWQLRCLLKTMTPIITSSAISNCSAAQKWHVSFLHRL